MLVTVWRTDSCRETIPVANRMVCRTLYYTSEKWVKPEFFCKLVDTTFLIIEIKFVKIHVFLTSTGLPKRMKN